MEKDSACGCNERCFESTGGDVPGKKSVCVGRARTGGCGEAEIDVGVTDLVLSSTICATLC